MAFDYSKRLSTIQKEVEKREGEISPRKALVLSIIALLICVAILPKRQTVNIGTETSSQHKRSIEDITNSVKSFFGAGSSKETTNITALNSHWEENLKLKLEGRFSTLTYLPFGQSFANRYYRFCQSVLGTGGATDRLTIRRPAGIVERFLTIFFLDLGFILFSFLPFWLLAIALGIYWTKYRMKPTPTKDFLGVCDPGVSPFYSGIYAPFVPNGGASASDFSAPGLATPQKISLAEASKHKLAMMLRGAQALNGTTQELVQIILAYRDYPGFVEEERAAEEYTDATEDSQSVDTAPAKLGFVAPGNNTLEHDTCLSLEALLEAHQILKDLWAKVGDALAEDRFEALFGDYLSAVGSKSKQTSQLVQTLIQSLTPRRSQALAKLPTHLVAAAFLATEAGKGFTYERTKDLFHQVSRYPHLQARAVIQSILSFHTEYNGEERRIIRQAVICSRRHGDFGRAQLPIDMSIPTRALRGWLEILYAVDEKRKDAGELMELDTHIEEIHEMWKRNIVERLKIDAAKEKSSLYPMWKGVVYKSVILQPLAGVIEISLQNISSQRLERIQTLIACTRDDISSLSISARLPGFKRQAMEAERSAAESGGRTSLLAVEPQEQDLLNRWLVVRRMLTRYNWLSTRVGDDAVPTDGLMQGIVLLRDEEQHVVGFDALVPLRQRRYKELCGDDWENRFFLGSPHPDDIEVFSVIEDFKKTLTERAEQAKRGNLISLKASRLALVSAGGNV
ncbi:hypothetical protein JNK13_10405 [bacterium]|nr:hypothetical protein [bacterium]